LWSIRSWAACFRLRATGEILETARGKADPAGPPDEPARGSKPPFKGRTLMTTLLSPRSLLLAGAFLGAFTCHAAAQQAPAAPAPAASPLPPGSPMIGRP